MGAHASESNRALWPQQRVQPAWHRPQPRQEGRPSTRSAPASSGGTSRSGALAWRGQADRQRRGTGLQRQKAGTRPRPARRSPAAARRAAAAPRGPAHWCGMSRLTGSAAAPTGRPSTSTSPAPTRPVAAAPRGRAHWAAQPGRTAAPPGQKPESRHGAGSGGGKGPQPRESGQQRRPDRVAPRHATAREAPAARQAARLMDKVPGIPQRRSHGNRVPALADD